MSFLRIIATALAAALISAAPAQAAAREIEQQVKAAFLFNFASFAAWPAEKFATPQSPIELCLFDDDPLGPVLEQSLKGKFIEGRPLIVRRDQDESAWAGCHLVYLGAAPTARVAATLYALAGLAVLTVHESEAALTRGVIRLYVEQRKLRFEINTTAAQNEHLQLSSKLLSLASVVQK